MYAEKCSTILLTDQKLQQIKVYKNKQFYVQICLVFAGLVTYIVIMTLLQGEAYEMQTFKEPHYGRRGRLTITDPNYSAATKKKKKRLDQLTEAEVKKLLFC